MIDIPYPADGDPRWDGCGGWLSHLIRRLPYQADNSAAIYVCHSASHHQRGLCCVAGEEVIGRTVRADILVRGREAEWSGVEEGASVQISDEDTGLEMCWMVAVGGMGRGILFASLTHG